ncbi:MAG: hypothetical protein JXA89_14800 [Anaerolineae bacterium]|nr:hypothetical protein [Anaerolineae bacterium]
MSGYRSHPVPGVVFKFYQALLHVYPAEHRREYGPLMIQTFRDMCRETYRHKGTLGLIVLSVHVFVDTVISSIAEHLDRLEYGARKMTKKQHFVILVFAGFPLVLGFVLFAVNPQYMGRMFMPGYANAQPLGGMMTAAVVVMAAVAYVIQRWSLMLSDRLVEEGNRGKAVIPRIWFVTSFILFIIPAVLLVVFGPAMLRLIEAGVIG